VLSELRIAARKRKLAGLETELVQWEKESSAGQPLRLNYSQIGRITGVIRRLGKQIAAPAATPASSPPLTDRDLETTALELHRIWEFFRSKFAMRKVEWLRTYLDAMDDFALACYTPARDSATAVATGGLREPPLVYFGGGWSPFAMPRDYPFEAERVPDEPVRNGAFIEALRKLPLPVVAIPWFQIAHLPDAVVIGHEVGHLVEDDLGLANTVQSIVGGAADPSRQTAWKAWAGEVFGDFYGQLATGPAFPGAIAEVLADLPEYVVKEKAVPGKWGDYPTTYLRMNMNVAMLRAQKFAAAADALAADWKAVYGPTHAMSPFDADVNLIASALCDTPIAELGGKRFPEVLSFAGLEEESKVAVSRLEKRAMPNAGNVRALIAAARLFFVKKPEAYDDDAQKRVLQAIALSFPPGVRDRKRSTAEEAADAALSTDLMTLLSGRARSQPQAASDDSAGPPAGQE
jgi:hypothetical protein